MNKCIQPKRLLIIFLFELISLCGLATQAVSGIVQSRNGQDINQVSLTELQWSLCEKSVDDVIKKLQLKIEKPPKVRNNYYIETKNLELQSRNAVIRIRANSEKIKSSAKINFAVEKEIPWSLLKPMDYSCEEDRYLQLDKFGCQVNFEARDLQNSLSDDQKKYLQHGAGFNHWNELELWGPVAEKEWTVKSAMWPAEIVLDAVSIPNKFESLEISLRVTRGQSELMQKNFTNWLSERKIELCPKQIGKTGEILRVLVFGK